MQRKVDVIVENYIVKYKQYNQGVDILSTRASDQLKRLESENMISINNTNITDQLTRDIELMRLKRQAAMKSEEILTQVHGDIMRERMLEKFQEFKKILNHEMPIYDDKGAEAVYRRLVADLSENIKSKPSLRNLELVRDPYSLGQGAITPIDPFPGQNNFLPQQPTPMPVAGANNGSFMNNTGANPAGGVQALILQQNHSMIDKGFFRNPKGFLDSTYYTTHKGEITAILALNSRYIVTASSDKTVVVWDIQNPRADMVILNDFDGEVINLKKIMLDQRHPLGHLLVTVENYKAVDNIGVFDLTTQAHEVPCLYSRDLAEYVNAIDVLGQNSLAVGYANGIFKILEAKTLNALYQADLKSRIDALLVLPDRKTVVIACDNEYSILEVSPNLQVVTKAKRKDTATFGFLRSLGRNSEVFSGFLKNGMIKMYRAFDGECLNVVLGQRGEYDSSLVLNFFSTDPNVYLLTLSKHNPYFRFCNIDDTQMNNLVIAQPLHSVARGEPKMQILEMVSESHIIFATIGNVPGKPPGLYIWRLTFN